MLKKLLNENVNIWFERERKEKKSNVASHLKTKTMLSEKPVQKSKKDLSKVHLQLFYLYISELGCVQ